LFINLENNFYLRYQDIKEIIPYSTYYKKTFLNKKVKKDYVIDLTQQYKKRNVIITDNGYYIITRQTKKNIEQSILKK